MADLETAVEAGLLYGIPEGWEPQTPPTHHTEAATLEREFGPADENGVYGARS